MPVDAASAVLLVALDGVDLNSEEAAFLVDEGPAGYTLFKRNIPTSFAELRKLTSKLQALNPSSKALLIAIDQEGGRVSRLHYPFPDLGPAMLLEEGGDQSEQLISLQNYGFVVGSALRGLGINWNFAPVCDVLTRDDNPAIGDRAFAARPQLVGRRAGAFLEGLEASGLLGCLKHFPGQGGASFDTHEGAAAVSCSKEDLEATDLLPFRQLLADHRPVMVSHVTYTSLDDQPASMSPAIIQGLLRQQLGFAGLVVSDDMNMKAIQQDDLLWEQCLVDSLLAGVDLLLVCRGLDRCQKALARLRQEAARSPAFATRLDEAAQMVMSLRKRVTR